MLVENNVPFYYSVRIRFQKALDSNKYIELWMSCPNANTAQEAKAIAYKSASYKKWSQIYIPMFPQVVKIPFEGNGLIELTEGVFEGGCDG